MAKYKILLIDDEDSVLNALKRTLHSDRYQIFTSKSAEEAIPVIQQYRIDLCDYKLRGMDGIELLEKVEKESPDTMLFLLTGHADVKIVMDAVNRLSLQGFIVKPWDNEELKSTVEAVLEKRGEKKLKKLKARDIMSKFAITVREDMRLVEVAHLMMRFKISGLPVISKEGKIVGIITATDLFRTMGEATQESLSSGSLSDRSKPTSEVMTREVCTVEKEATLSEIILTMCTKNIHTLPVVEGDEIIGIIGRRDVINSFYSLFETSHT
ncbi:CBS domain-containing protein [Thermoproteota archaeon]